MQEQPNVHTLPAIPVRARRHPALTTRVWIGAALVSEVPIGERWCSVSKINFQALTMLLVKRATPLGIK